MENIYRYAVRHPVSSVMATQGKGLINYYRGQSKLVGVPTCMERFEEYGNIDNFRAIAYPDSGRINVRKMPNADEFVFKLMEAYAFYAGDEDGAPFSEALNEMIGLVCLAQDEDGYLNTYYQMPGANLQRFAKKNRFEFYNMGHLITAAVAYLRAAGNDALIAPVCRFADLVSEKFSSPNHLPYDYEGRDEINLQYEHPQHELAFIELYRATGNKKYLDFALQTLEEYRYWDFKNNYGHAVQVENLNIAATDAYLECGDEKMLKVCKTLWEDMYRTKMYITGGVGAHYRGECFGSRYDLPNQRAYSETCGAITNFMYAHKMLLATGESRYADCMEQILYNGVLVGYDTSGSRYFYINPLQYDPYDTHFPEQKYTSLHFSRLQMIGKDPWEDPEGRTLRWKWHGCPCCPPNIHRLLASIGNYLFTAGEGAITVEMYASALVNIGESTSLKMDTAYPMDGHVTFTVSGKSAFRLRLRIPAWCGQFALRINGREADFIKEGRYAVISRAWKDGDQVQLNMDLSARIVIGHPASQNCNAAALMRGPLVYCLEEADHSGLDIFSFRIGPDTALEAVPTSIAGINTLMLKGNCPIVSQEAWAEEPYVPAGQAGSAAGGAEFTAIPYCLWSNRGIGKMRVWIPLAGALVHA